MASYSAVQRVEDAQVCRQDALEWIEIGIILAEQRGERDLAARLHHAAAALLRQKTHLVRLRAIVAPAKRREKEEAR